ncbi:MAG: sulfatase [Proteobacteria bacterium]|nr:sulfatase [Pseudomonadota bacterium]
MKARTLTSSLMLLLFSVILLTACKQPLPQVQVETRAGLKEVFQADYNVLVVSFDALRADTLGVYGYSRPVSPNIDHFAESSLVFDNAHSAAQSTPTSFAAAWTGRLPLRVFRGWKLIDRETLAAAFLEAGFVTAGFTDNQQLLPERGFSTGFQTYVLQTEGNDDKLLQASLDWLQLNHEKKFFAWFHFLSPHTPYDYREMATDFYEPGYKGRFKKSAKGHFEINSPAELKRARDLYDGEVFYADSIFQSIREQLQALGIDKRTIIVLTSDHGEEFMDHGGLQHNSVYEEVLRIPLIISHPGMNSGKRTDINYSNVDLYKTLLAIVGIDTDKITDGINLLNRVPQRRPILATAMTAKLKRQFGMLMENDKYQLDCMPESSERLFDLQNDTKELNDLALDFPEKLEQLYQTLEIIVGKDPCSVMQKATAGKSIESDLSEEQMERLKSLGYIQ